MFAPLDQLHSKMGVTENDHVILKGAEAWHALTPDELRRLSIEGIDVDIDEVKYAEDGTFEYKGQKVIIYIRDQLYFERARPWNYKYHICTCKKIREMKEGGRLHRYVVSTRKDGKFLVTKVDPSSRKPIPNMKKIEEPLDVCKYCLGEMLDFHPEEISLFRFSSFSLNEFLERFATKHLSIPAHTESTAPFNVYSDNWDKISRDTRKARDYKCEGVNCPNSSTDFSGRPDLMHVHHINGNKSDNRQSNLRVLCEDCHKSQPFHNHMEPQ